MTALRLVMERILPPRRDRPVEVDMPRITAASDLIAAAAALTQAVASGDITPGEAADLSRLFSREHGEGYRGQRTRRTSREA